MRDAARSGLGPNPADPHRNSCSDGNASPDFPWWGFTRHTDRQGALLVNHNLDLRQNSEKFSSKFVCLSDGIVVPADLHRADPVELLQQLASLGMKAT